MVRVQVQFTDEQLRRLREQARRQGASVAATVRQLVTRGLEAETDSLDSRYRAALSFVGTVHDPDGTTDIAARHDDYLDEAFR
jgi:hypothetical protein